MFRNINSVNGQEIYTEIYTLLHTSQKLLVAMHKINA